MRLDISDKGRQMHADEVARDVCGGAIGKGKVIDLFARDIGYKPGKRWIFFENDAREAWARHLSTIKGKGLR